ncbi:hypothetical protein K8R03_02735 [Candidatus Kaiserbacteria bacterium]|nr:hypothetical protein [Candidatus Kaiserbacteria bacterium]
MNQSIDIDIQSPFGNGVVHLHLNILQPSFIARQDLVAGPEGIFNSLTEPKLAPLSDMHPGDRAALLISRDANLRVGTYYIIFGNPL